MKYLFVIFFALLCIQCHSQEKFDKCRENDEKSSRCIFEYQMTENAIYLDSALFYINEVLGTCQIDYKLALRKVIIYTEKQDFEKAINFTDSLDSNLFFLPYYKSLISNRVKAMKAQYEGDTIARNKFINTIVLEVGDYMEQNKNEIDSFMKLPDIEEVLKSPYSIVPVQYYYYKSLIEGVEKTKLQVDSLQQAIRGNEEYFEMIKVAIDEDFMYFVGF